MKPALLLLLLLGLSLLSFSQPAPDTLWVRSYPDLGLSWPADAIVTPDGDIVTTGMHGMYPDSSLGWANLFVAKFDGEGNLLWYTEFPGEVDRAAMGKGICMAADGGYMVYGKHDTLMSPHDGTHALLLKVSQSGEILWHREYVLGLDAYIYTIKPTLDGCFILGGGESYYEQPPHGFLLKVTADGDSLWARIYDDDLYGEHIVCTMDSGFAIAGRLGGGPTVTGVAKTDAQGVKEWEYEYGSDGWPCGIAETADSGHVVAGQQWYPFIMKINHVGDGVWNYTDEPDSGESNQASAMMATTDGGFLIAGESVPNSPGPSPMHILKVNSEGHPVWEVSRGTGNHHHGNSLCPTSDGGFVTVGSMTPMDHDPWWGMLEIMRFGPAQSNHASSVPLVPSRISLGQNYPNPFNPTTDIAFDLPRTGMTTLLVYDVLGREVTKLADGVMTSGHHTIAFDGSRLTSGLYFYKLRSAGISRTRKMLLMK